MFDKARLCIDIRGHMLKVVEGSLNDIGIVKLNKVAYFDTKNAVLKDDRMINCQENIESFKKFLSKYRFSANKVFLNIADTKVITRLIKLPKMPIGDLTNLVNLEAPKSFPIDLSKFYVDFRVLNSFNEENKLFCNILVCAVPGDIVREYVDLLLGCDLEPVIVDIHANSISRIYQNTQYEDIAILDASVDCADLLILEKGYFNIYTTFHFEIPGYSELYRNASDYKLENIQEQLNELIKNVQNYIRFYMSRNEGKKLDTLYVTGELATIDGIEEYLQRELQIKVIKGFSNFIEVKKSKKIANINDNLYSGNIGILLRGV